MHSKGLFGSFESLRKGVKPLKELLWNGNQLERKNELKN